MTCLTVEVTDRNGFVDEYDYDVFNRCVAARDLTAGFHTGEPEYFETTFDKGPNYVPKGERS